MGFSLSRPSPQAMQQLVAEITKLVDSKAVVVLSKTYCPYCSEAKRILSSLIPSEKLGEMEIVELDQKNNGAAMQSAAQSITNQRTVPQIWINKQFVGGCSELKAIQAKGELKTLLDTAGLQN